VCSSDLTARVEDPSGSTEVAINYRRDGDPGFTRVLMQPGTPSNSTTDRHWVGTVPPHPDGVIEFFVEAHDASGRIRTWPAPVQPENAQVANALYQIDDVQDEA